MVALTEKATNKADRPKYKKLSASLVLYVSQICLIIASILVDIFRFKLLS
jgi:hypothetical protein